MKSLVGARVIVCEFEATTRAELESGHFKARTKLEKSELVFDAIDLTRGVATLVSTGGKVQAFLSQTGLTFVEGAEYSNHSFTTVFPVPAAAAGTLVAVSSVHSLIPGIRLKTGEEFYVPEQRYGSCKVRP